jgi:hypothetical protein
LLPKSGIAEIFDDEEMQKNTFYGRSGVTQMWLK